MRRCWIKMAFMQPITTWPNIDSVNLFTHNRRKHRFSISVRQRCQTGGIPACMKKVIHTCYLIHPRQLLRQPPLAIRQPCQCPRFLWHHITESISDDQFFIIFIVFCDLTLSNAFFLPTAAIDMIVHNFNHTFPCWKLNWKLLRIITPHLFTLADQMDRCPNNTQIIQFHFSHSDTEAFLTVPIRPILHNRHRLFAKISL